jgi:hypothetical protein
VIAGYVWACLQSASVARIFNRVRRAPRSLFKRFDKGRNQISKSSKLVFGALLKFNWVERELTRMSG